MSRSIRGGGPPALPPCAAATDAVRKTHAKQKESLIRGTAFLAAGWNRRTTPFSSSLFGGTSEFPPARGLGGFVLQNHPFLAACARMRPQPLRQFFSILRRVVSAPGLLPHRFQ